MPKDKITDKVDETEQKFTESGMEDVSTIEEATGKILALLADEKKYKLITELSDKEISDFAAALALAKHYKLALLQTYLETFLQLRISKKRAGRREVLELGIAKLKAAMEGQGWRNRFASMFGGGERFR